MKTTSMLAVAVAILVGASATTAAGPARLYVTNLGGQSLTVVDAATLKPLHTIPTAPDPHFAVATPDGTRLFVTMGPHINRRTVDNVRRAGFTVLAEHDVFSHWVKVIVASNTTTR